MKAFIPSLIGAILGTTLVCVSAHADNSSFQVGGAIDLSVPSGAAVGLQARLPYVPWFKVGVSATYLFSVGVRANLLIDPLQSPVAPIADISYGYETPFKIPSVANSPDVSFNDLNLLAGLGFGSRDHTRFLLLGGMSRLNGQAANFSNLVHTNGVTIASPEFHVWIPAARLAVEWLF